MCDSFVAIRWALWWKWTTGVISPLELCSTWPKSVNPAFYKTILISKLATLDKRFFKKNQPVSNGCSSESSINIQPLEKMKCVNQQVKVKGCSPGARGEYFNSANLTHQSQYRHLEWCFCFQEASSNYTAWFPMMYVVIFVFIYMVLFCSRLFQVKAS